jgi:hypothetical protein
MLQFDFEKWVLPSSRGIVWSNDQAYRIWNNNSYQERVLLDLDHEFSYIW